MKKLFVLSFSFLLFLSGANAQSWLLLGGDSISPGQANYTSIAIDNNGVPYVIYQDGSDSNKATVIKYDGVNWSVVGSAGFSTGEVDFTSIAIDGSGTPYVFYRNTNGVNGTVMKYYGNDWVTVGNFPSYQYGIEYTSIAIDGNGTPYVVFANNDGGAALVMNYDGTNWTYIGNNFTSPFADAEWPSIAVDANGTPYVVFTSAGSNSYEGVLVKYDGSEWVTLSDTFGMNGLAYTSIAIDPNGTPYIVFEDGNVNSKATVMKYSSNRLVNVGSPGLSVGEAFYTSIAVDGNGNPYVVYADGSKGFKATVMQYNGSNWMPVGGVGFSQGSASNTSIAIDNNGIPFVVFTNGGAWGYKFDKTCSAHFTLYPDTTTAHRWFALNQATGVPPLTYSWNWGDGSSPSTGPMPSHTYSDSGYYTICLTITDSTGCSSTWCDSSTYLRSTEALMVTVDVVTQLPASAGILQIADEKAAFSIYPNPASNNFIIETEFGGKQQLQVFDITGRLVLSEPIENNKTTINTAGFAPGIYSVRLKSVQGYSNKKLVIAK